jgi:hypothetical protein
MTETTTVTEHQATSGPALWPPLLGIAWAVVPFAASALLGASDIGVTVVYLWCWAIIIPAAVLGIGALVVRYRYGAAGSGGRFRRALWYWTGGIYAAVALPVLAWLL